MQRFARWLLLAICVGASGCASAQSVACSPYALQLIESGYGAESTAVIESGACDATGPEPEDCPAWVAIKLRYVAAYDAWTRCEP
jgi:hypothetical protein